MTYVPGEPDSWHCYCDECGTELDDDNLDEECAPCTAEDMAGTTPIERIS